ncbi:hypothetical protein RF55_13685 [Lasius niger]|uniref:Uncharacterized protein n=1 Tax=Lasius niger TaxID=67767 RepID=A0A0J7KA75_LASNI|nr:hypothetical protein RF55_13685 [Lasius niger]
MAIVTLRNVDQKKQVLDKKRKLRRREERIEEDLTWEERRSKWMIREIARREEKEGKKVWIGKRGLQIEGVWWR